MNISQKTSISTLLDQVNKEQLTILVDHALLLDVEAPNGTLERNLKDLKLRNLQQLLFSCAKPQFIACAEDALSSSFDQAFAFSLGTPQPDGLTGRARIAYEAQKAERVLENSPVASPNLTQIESGNDPALGYAFVHLCHWRVGGGHVILNNISELDSITSETYRKKLEPLFLSEGIELLPFRHDTWIARSKHFLHLPSASFNKVMNDDVLPWLIGSAQKNIHNNNPQIEASIQILRRLQSEVQMVLYDLSQNAPLPGSFNSIWFSSTGEPPKSREALKLLSSVDNSLEELFQNNDRQILCLHGLTPHLQNYDLYHWSNCFEEIDEVFFNSAFQKSKLTIVLCGKSGFKVWHYQPMNAFQSSLQALKNKFLGSTSTLQLLT